MVNAPQLRGRAVRFAGVGVTSTVLYLAIFVVVRGSLGAQVANLFALLVSAVVNTILNKRLTFGLRGPTGPREQAQGLAVFALGAVLTSGALSLLHASDPTAGRLLEITVLIVATAIATVIRFVLFSRWIFATAPAETALPSPSSEGNRPPLA